MKHRRLQILIASSLLVLAESALSVTWLWPAPKWAAQAFQQAGVSLTPAAGARYVVTTHLNPFILFGDFDGDHKTDVAVLVRESKTSKIGIAIARQTGAVDVIGAGRALGHGGDNFEWLDHWYTYTKAPVSKGADETTPPVLVGDALLVEKSESASAIIYFTGSRYAWYQQGD